MELVFIYTLSHNTPMLRMARSAGAHIEREGADSEAFLRLPAPDAQARWSDRWERHYGELDYQLKKQARQFWRVMAQVRRRRQGGQKKRVESVACSGV